MASLQAKIGRKTQRKRKNKNYHSVPFRSYTTHNTKFQKNSKKIQKIQKNTIVASFQSEIGWRRPRKRDKENYRSDPFQTDS